MPLTSEQEIGTRSVREVNITEGTIYFNLVDGKLTLWDKPNRTTVAVHYAILDGFLHFRDAGRGTSET
jgi:hypothetical protein